MFYIPSNETVRETFERLADGTALGWPGSTSIHGKTNPVSKSARKHQQEKRNFNITIPKRTRNIANALAKTNTLAARQYLDSFYYRDAVERRV
jgi:hypothetical protein